MVIILKKKLNKAKKFNILCYKKMKCNILYINCVGSATIGVLLDWFSPNSSDSDFNGDQEYVCVYVYTPFSGCGFKKWHEVFSRRYCPSLSTFFSHVLWRIWILCNNSVLRLPGKGHIFWCPLPFRANIKCPLEWALIRRSNVWRIQLEVHHMDAINVPRPWFVVYRR